MSTTAPTGGQRSRKDLECTAAATAYQRDFVADLKRRVIDGGEPFAIAQADTPHEIFHVMDIPLILYLRQTAVHSLRPGVEQARLSGESLPLLFARPGLHAR
jgi:hypothetical protein